MNTQPAQPIPGKGQQPDSDQATISINAAQLARIAELLDILDGFLRHADGVADRPITCTPPDATAPNPLTGPATTRTCSSIRSASPPTPFGRAHRREPLQ